MKHHGCRSHVRDQNKLTGQEERFDLVVDSNDVILERVVRPAALPLIQSSSLKEINSTTGPCVCLPGDPSWWSWWREPEPAARHACRLSASKDRRFQLESQGWLINLTAPPVIVPVFFATISSWGFVQTLCANAIQRLKVLNCCRIDTILHTSLLCLQSLPSGLRLWQRCRDVPTPPSQECCKAAAEIQGKSWQQQHAVYSQDLH